MQRTFSRKYDEMFMDIAMVISQRSHDERYKVGAIIVKDANILAIGWNGMPSGMNNQTRTDGVTNPEVIHAEANALMKLARTGGNALGATIYSTLAPCFSCAKLIVQAGIKDVVYKDLYDIESKRFLVGMLGPENMIRVEYDESTGRTSGVSYRQDAIDQ